LFRIRQPDDDERQLSGWSGKTGSGASSPFVVARGNLPTSGRIEGR
jgi:hypothetical protein